MLTYSLTGTTEDSGFDRNEHSHRPPERGLSPDHTQSLTDTESSRATASLRRGSPVLTC